jgi:predicted DNA-binding protein with PD1-like motif
MKLHTFRLQPGQDLKPEIEKFVRENKIQAGFIVTCVAGLEYATLRMAGATPNAQDVRTISGPLEVTSLVGTVSVNGSHLHLTVTDKEGRALGGHLKENSPVHFTAEIVIGEDAESIYNRKLDEQTGFTELEVTSK